MKSVDFYDSKFDLGALSIADLSLHSSSDTQDFAEFKRAIKFSLFFQPAFSVCWFLGVVALENRQSCIMPVTFIVCYNILVSWNHYSSVFCCRSYNTSIFRFSSLIPSLLLHFFYVFYFFFFMFYFYSHAKCINLYFFFYRIGTFCTVSLT